MKLRRIQVMAGWMVGLAVAVALLPLPAVASETGAFKGQAVQTDCNREGSQARALSEPYPSTPEGVMKAYIATSYRPKSLLGIVNTGEVGERIKYYTDPSPGFGDFFVITGWTVTTLWQSGSESQVRVRYHVLGVASLDEFSCERRQESDDYSLIKVGDKWQIVGPRTPPTFSVASTAELYRFWTREYPSRAESFSKSLQALERCAKKK